MGHASRVVLHCITHLCPCSTMNSAWRSCTGMNTALSRSDVIHESPPWAGCGLWAPVSRALFWARPQHLESCAEKKHFLLSPSSQADGGWVRWKLCSSATHLVISPAQSAQPAFAEWMSAFTLAVKTSVRAETEPGHRTGCLTLLSPLRESIRQTKWVSRVFYGPRVARGPAAQASWCLLFSEEGLIHVCHLEGWGCQTPQYK